MKIAKQLLDFYINSSIHVALAVYALSWITLTKFGLNYDENVLYFNFYATITGYNFVKYFGIAKWHHRSLAKWLKIIQIFSLICFVLLCYYGLQLQTKLLFIIGVFAVITFLYAIPFLPKRLYLDTQQNLRDISGLKVYVIALVWSGVTVLIPILNNNYVIDADVIITLLQVFIFVIVLMLPFEIRDLRYDSLKLATIPQKVGVKLTKIAGIILLILFCVAEFFKAEITPSFYYSQILTSLILGLFLVFAHKKRSQYYASFFVESVPIIWLLLMFL